MSFVDQYVVTADRCGQETKGFAILFGLAFPGVYTEKKYTCATNANDYYHTRLLMESFLAVWFPSRLLL